MSKTRAQAHLLSSTLYPVPLVSVICVADEANIIPLMCSALHQRIVLGLQDFPVLGLLHDPRDSDVFRILIGWLCESPTGTPTVRPPFYNVRFETHVTDRQCRYSSFTSRPLLTHSRPNTHLNMECSISANLCPLWPSPIFSLVYAQE